MISPQSQSSENDQQYVYDRMSNWSRSIDQNSVFPNGFDDDFNEEAGDTVNNAQQLLGVSWGKSQPMPVHQPSDQENQEDETKTIFDDPQPNLSSESVTYPVQRTLRDQNINAILKNFLVLLSIWMRNFFIEGFEKSKIQEQVYQRFERLVCRHQRHNLIVYRIRNHRRQRHYRKIYINLKTLSNLFSEQLLKPYLTEFFNSYILRYIVTSKTEHKQQLLRFLPVLKRGLVQGRITNLR